VCRAIDSAPDLQLVAGVDPSHVGETLGTIIEVHVELPFVGAIDEVDPDDVDVVIVGTTGFTTEDIEGFRLEFTDSNCLIAPNFAIGAVMMMRMAELAAPFFETAEVIEFHHNAKRDAPSGTAMMTAGRIQDAKDASGTKWDEDPTEHQVVEGARGGKVGGVGVHGVRMHGMVAHQEVIFGTTGETLTIRHDSIHRDSFMPGVLLGARSIGHHPGVTLGLDALLFD
jgi:4-hydroxy-tetrahydrodipicolinate reductase